MIVTESQTSDPNKIEVLERNLYYPFGAVLEGTWNSETDPLHNYRYNGKEWHGEAELGWLDFGFRYYDPAIGRFPSVDPIADQFAFVSPFNYAENEPVGHIDLWGLQKAKKDDDPSNDHDRARDEALDRLPFMSMTGVSPDNISNEYEGQVVQESWKWARMNQAIWKFIVEVVGSANFNINGWAGTTIVGQAPKAKGFFGKIGGFFKGIFGKKGGGVGSGSKASGNIAKDNGIGLQGLPGSTETTRALVPYYPPNGGALGEWRRTTLSPGSIIDRYGSGYGRYFSPQGTSDFMRALPPGNSGVLSSYRIIKPLNIEESIIAPAFGKPGGGLQYFSKYLNAIELEQAGYIIKIP